METSTATLLHFAPYLLIAAVLIGLAAAGLTMTIHAVLGTFPRWGHWLLLRKPASCPLCMSCWSTLLIVATTHGGLAWPYMAPVVLASIAISTVLLKLKFRWLDT